MVNIPHLRKISNYLVLSAILVLLSTPLLLSNLLQPVHAQSNFSFRTTGPADGHIECSNTAAKLTFDAQGSPSASNPQRVDITGGTFQISDSSDRQILYSGNIQNGRFSNSSAGGGGSLIIYTAVNHVPNGTSACASTSDTLTIDTGCSTNNENSIEIGFLGQGADGFGTFRGAVDCSSQIGGGGDSTTTQQSSSSSSSSTATVTVTTTEDRDGDGILDANDNCPNLPHTSCYKEGDTGIVVHNGNS